MPLVNVHFRRDALNGEVSKLIDVVPLCVAAAMKRVLNETVLTIDVEIRVTQAHVLDQNGPTLAVTLFLYDKPSRRDKLQLLGATLGMELGDEKVVMPDYIEVIMRPGVYVEPSA